MQHFVRTSGVKEIRWIDVNFWKIRWTLKRDDRRHSIPNDLRDKGAILAETHLTLLMYFFFKNLPF